MPFKAVDPKPNFPKLEEEILKFWEDNKIFEKSLEKTRPKTVIPAEAGIYKIDPRVKPEDEKHELFTFYDGPPFATGLPHYGHILASTIKDVIPRYQTMKGRFVRRRWGWDCHGLPIEEIVERKLGISGKKDIEKLGIKKFNEICRSIVLEFVTEWKKTIRRIARWVEFDNSYKTMDRDYMESVWWAFKQIYDKGLVYEGRKVLLYCPRCETPVSNFEVAMDNSYKDVTEEAVTVKFKVKKSFVIARRKPPTKQSRDRHGATTPRDDEERDTYLLAWTTTPWTLPGNVALAVGKEIEYVKVEVGEEYYIVAKDRVSFVIASEAVAERGNPRLVPSEEGIASENTPRNDEIIKGSDLVGLEYEPLFEIPEMVENKKSYKIYTADFVNTDEGTGIVHTAVVHGEDDYTLGIKEGLPVVPLLDEKGKFNDKAPKLIQGQYFKDAEKLIKNDLESRGLIQERKMHQHSYPFCWRCGTTLYYNAIPAWFVDTQKIKNKLIKSNAKEINWYPEHLKAGRYEKSLKSAPDRNISRNRYWGNPIPVWKCEKCGKNTVVGSIKELKRKAINFSVILNAVKNPRDPSATPQDDKYGGIDLHRPYIDEVVLRCDHCGGEARRISEILDSWTEAASMPFAEYHYPFENRKVFESRFPAQFVAEYIAQTRAWFYVMHEVSLILFGRAPFENVVTTGTILAEDGSKMSKSKNNFPDPWQVIEKYGVDSLRFYLMNSAVMQADNLNFSEKDLATTHRKVVLILWNVYNYFVTYNNSVIASGAAAERGNPRLVPSEEGIASENTPRNDSILDQWIKAKSQELINLVTKYLDDYDTVHATHEIESFVNNLSTWYLRRSRGRNDKGFFETLQSVLLELSKVAAPFMPYISEAIYQNLVIASGTPRSNPTGIATATTPRDDSEIASVHLSDWPEAKKLTKDQEQLLKQMESLRRVVEEVHALRAKAGIKLRQPLPRLVIPAQAGIQVDPRVKPEDDSLLSILKSEVNVKEIEVYSVIPDLIRNPDWILNQVQDDKWVALNVKIDESLKLEGLTAELTRQIQQLRKEAGLKIGQMAELHYETKSDMIEKALAAVDKHKTYLSTLRPAQGLKGAVINVDGNKIILKI